jgi:hypothetical protein
MPSHPVFPDCKVLGNLVLLEEINPLQGVVNFFIFQPLVFGHEFSLFFVIQCHPLETYCHVLHWVTLAVGYDLVVVRVAHPVQVEKVLAHLWERFVECKDIMGFQVSL